MANVPSDVIYKSVTPPEPTERNLPLPLTSSFVDGFVLSIATVPRRYVFVMELLPRTAVFEPRPVVPYPITISFVLPVAPEFV